MTGSRHPRIGTASSPADRVRASIRRPFVTGATCAMRRELVQMMAPVPRRWLFDRWATLVAAARDGLVLQPDVVIRYRIHPDQLLGDRQATGPVGSRRWRQVLARGASPLEAAVRARDVVRRIRPLAIDATIRDELSWRSLARAAHGTDRSRAAAGVVSDDVDRAARAGRGSPGEGAGAAAAGDRLVPAVAHLEFRPARPQVPVQGDGVRVDVVAHGPDRDGGHLQHRLLGDLPRRAARFRERTSRGSSSCG